MSEPHQVAIPAEVHRSFATKVIEWFILEVPRYFLMALLTTLSVVSGVYGLYLAVQYVHTGLEMVHNNPASEVVIGVLEALDGVLLIAVVFLINAGTYVLYVDKNPNRDLPIALQNLSSGTLKEKLLSSLITVGAVYLFKLSIELTLAGNMEEAALIVRKIEALIGVVVTFVLCYAVIAHSNRHHDASHAGGSPSKPTH